MGTNIVWNSASPNQPFNIITTDSLLKLSQSLNKGQLKITSHSLDILIMWHASQSFFLPLFMAPILAQCLFLSMTSTSSIDKTPQTSHWVSKLYSIYLRGVFGNNFKRRKAWASGTIHNMCMNFIHICTLYLIIQS